MECAPGGVGRGTSAALPGVSGPRARPWLAAPTATLTWAASWPRGPTAGAGRDLGGRSPRGYAVLGEWLRRW
ncbi:hypothetical protein JOF53_008253 [Crossiella equi]|uniref:Uncharacterized protein n=1 Tax=Crossiella equi TaxID=130796 RepID=A0ABS5AS39_9PSEU|nr:hypothetical protein [Crossiella equi]MBP2479381.1 hypothetical protein [Crossiella equi]